MHTHWSSGTDWFSGTPFSISTSFAKRLGFHCSGQERWAAYALEGKTTTAKQPFDPHYEFVEFHVVQCSSAVFNFTNKSSANSGDLCRLVNYGTASRRSKIFCARVKKSRSPSGGASSPA